MKYQLFRNAQGEVKSVLKTDDNGMVWGIPFDLDNTDYQDYLAWVTEGNVAEPADQQGEQV